MRAAPFHALSSLLARQLDAVLECSQQSRELQFLVATGRKAVLDLCELIENVDARCSGKCDRADEVVDPCDDVLQCETFCRFERGDAWGVPGSGLP